MGGPREGWDLSQIEGSFLLAAAVGERRGSNWWSVEGSGVAGRAWRGGRAKCSSWGLNWAGEYRGALFYDEEIFVSSWVSLQLVKRLLQVSRINNRPVGIGSRVMVVPVAVPVSQSLRQSRHPLAIKVMSMHWNPPVEDHLPRKTNKGVRERPQRQNANKLLKLAAALLRLWHQKEPTAGTRHCREGPSRVPEMLP